MSIEGSAAPSLKDRMEKMIQSAQRQQKSFALDVIEKSERLALMGTDRMYGRALELNSIFWSQVEKASSVFAKPDKHSFAPVGIAD